VLLGEKSREGFRDGAVVRFDDSAHARVTLLLLVAGFCAIMIFNVCRRSLHEQNPSCSSEPMQPSAVCTTLHAYITLLASLARNIVHPIPQEHVLLIIHIQVVSPHHSHERLTEATC
jgi:hypothetical protein